VRTCSTYEGEEVLAGKPVGKRPFWDSGVGGRIILRWTLRKWGRGAWTGLIWLRIVTGGGFL